jgi:pimeloyl-ACP methyl ester carboxylesterase
MEELGRRRFAYATPDYRGTTSWMSEPAEADITQLVGLLKTDLRAPRVYLIGASMGGSSALAYAVRHPELLDGVIDVCGTSDIGDFHGWCRATPSPPVLKELADAIEQAYGGTPAQKPGLYAGRSALAQAARLTMPVVMAHGESDAVIPVRYSRDLHRLLKGRGARALYREYPGGDHGAPLVGAAWGEWLEFVAAP